MDTESASGSRWKARLANSSVEQALAAGRGHVVPDRDGTGRFAKYCNLRRIPTEAVDLSLYPPQGLTLVLHSPVALNASRGPITRECQEAKWSNTVIHANNYDIMTRHETTAVIGIE